MKSYFILGTDTDCGKTYVTCRLLTYFQNQNKRIRAVKPVASGGNLQQGVFECDDVLRLMAHQKDLTEDIGLWRFEKPIAPHLAAIDKGVHISIESICDHIARQACDYLLIEGAGGLMVPLNGKETWLDFLVKTKIPVILVVGMTLGCINHALLTLAVLEAHQVDCKGWIANCLDEHMLYLDENIASLTERIECPLLAKVPYQQGMIEDEGLSSLF